MISFAEIEAAIQSLPIPANAARNPRYRQQAALYCAILAVGANAPKLAAYTGASKADIFDAIDRLNANNLLITGTLPESYLRTYLNEGDALIDRIVGRAPQAAAAPSTQPQKARPEMNKQAIARAIIAEHKDRFTLSIIRTLVIAKTSESEQQATATTAFALAKAVKEGRIHVVMKRPSIEGGNVYAPGPEPKTESPVPAPPPPPAPAPMQPRPQEPPAPPVVVAPASLVTTETGRVQVALQWTEGENTVELKASLHLPLTTVLQTLQSLTAKEQ